MSITTDQDISDIVNNTDYVSGTISVGTTQVEAKVGGSRLEERKVVRVYNDSNNTIYFGPSGVTTSTGEPLTKNNWVELDLGPDVGLFLIASSSLTGIIIQERS